MELAPDPWAAAHAAYWRRVLVVRVALAVGFLLMLFVAVAARPTPDPVFTPATVGEAVRVER